MVLQPADDAIGVINKGQEKLIYPSKEDLLENILVLKKYKYHRQPRYLSKKHERHMLKLGFVLDGEYGRLDHLNLQRSD